MLWRHRFPPARATLNLCVRATYEAIGAWIRAGGRRRSLARWASDPQYRDYIASIRQVSTILSTPVVQQTAAFRGIASLKPAVQSRAGGSGGVVCGRRLSAAEDFTDGALHCWCKARLICARARVGRRERPRCERRPEAVRRRRRLRCGRKRRRRHHDYSKSDGKSVADGWNMSYAEGVEICAWSRARGVYYTVTSAAGRLL